MRVIAGKLGGQIFDSPKGHKTHPMSEKMRGGLFGTLGDIEGLDVLDAFAGSGAISIEAFSRGAAYVQTIEVEPKAAKVVADNLKLLCLEEEIKLTRAYAGAWSTRHQDKLFDVIILDPPYDKIPFRDLDKMPRHLKPEGILVLSWPADYDNYHFPDLKEIKTKVYGDGKLIFYRTS